jgi:hypothetical protein
MKSDYVDEILAYLQSAFKVVEGNMDYFVGLFVSDRKKPSYR